MGSEGPILAPKLPVSRFLLEIIEKLLKHSTFLGELSQMRASNFTFEKIKNKILEFSEKFLADFGKLHRAQKENLGFWGLRGQFWPQNFRDLARYVR